MVNTREIAAELRLAHWAHIMQDRTASGMNISTYCQTRGIHKNVYFYWQRKLREAACQKLLPENQVRLAKSTTPTGWALCETTDSELKDGSSVHLEIGKFKITVNQKADIELFTRVCQALVQLC